MKILGIIPSRYAASRFPGKPLVDIDGKTMIQRVYEQAKKSSRLTDVVVATDDERIKRVINGIGGEAFITSEDHLTGTDRCGEVLNLVKNEYDYVINIQGDEPFIDPASIDALCDLLDYKTEIATLVSRIEDYETLHNPNVVKVILTMRKQALYFSRQVIPYVRGVDPENWLEEAEFFRHIGIYAYRHDVLEQIVKLPQNVLENTEKLEQLRWIGYGYRILATETAFTSIGIDTPEDLEKALSKKN